MSMIGPGTYRMDHEGDSWEELVRERARLNRSLRLFEHHHEELLNAECSMDPGPDVVYQCELEYLRELCDLTLRAMRRETGLAELFGDEEEDGEGEDAPGSIPRERVEEVNSQGFNIIDSRGNISYCEGC